MIIDPGHKLNVLEQKLTVMQQEISQVIGEMQVTMQGLAKMTSAALKLFDERLTALEGPKRINHDIPAPPTEGKEL
jgi:hypothetical protein